MTFELFVGIDYSGAETPGSRLAGLQVYAASPGQAPQPVRPPSCPPGKRWNWCRRELAAWLVGLSEQGTTFLAGIDHAFSFPASYLDRHGLATWPDFLDDFTRHWPTHQGGATVESLREGNPRAGAPDEFRLTERWTSSARSVFLFDVQGSVAKSSHAGVPWLRHVRQEAGRPVHFWPFDGWEAPEGRPVLAEVYPSLFRNRYPRSEGAAERTNDQQDAYATARWLEEATRRGVLGRYLSPPLAGEERRRAEREGWILGVS